MVLNLLRKRRTDRNEPRAAFIPEGQRVYAVGDIHGRSDLLDELLALIDADDAARGPAESHLVFLGDLIDRGPDSAGVVERLAQVAETRANVRLITGNHEEVFLLALDGDVEALRFFVRIGGRETILSYNTTREEYDSGDFDELLLLMKSRVPDRHMAFFRRFEDVVEIGDYLFVHAGIRPGVAPLAQKQSDLRWIREEFLNFAGDHGCLVVHGHTITEAVDLRPNRIGIDTGAFASGRLTAIGLEGGTRWFLATGTD